MIFGLARLCGVIWIFGTGFFALTATSNYLFSSEPMPDRERRFHSRLRISLLWPVALFSSAGRARLRNG